MKSLSQMTTQENVNEIFIASTISRIISELDLKETNYLINCEFNKNSKRYVTNIKFSYGSNRLTYLFQKYYDQQYRLNANVIDELNDSKIHIIMGKIFNYLMEIFRFKMPETRNKFQIVIAINYFHSTIYNNFLYTYLL